MSDEKSLASAKTLLTTYLVSNRLRQTPERFLILEKAMEMPDLFAAESLIAKVEEDVHVSRASIYNTLQLFSDAGILRKHELRNRTYQYEKAFNGKAQASHHLICSHCGKVKKIKDVDLASEINTRHYSTFKVTHYSLNIYGVCSKCAKLTNKKTNK